MLRTRLTLKPGQPGTRKLVEEHGPRLVCVRYRYDTVNHKRYKTAEIIIEEVDWIPRSPRPAVTDLVHIRLDYNERTLRHSVKLLGGTWYPPTRTWRIAYGAVVALRLTDRVVAAPSTADGPPPSTHRYSDE
ncbi:MAG TPA: hypothetical protein VEK11_18545 [Thermoanaerobaculia bacterium]|nr:hypothetical protein [Thermoanaerobaculia bacterium]